MKTLLMLAPFSENHVRRILDAAGDGWLLERAVGVSDPQELSLLLAAADAVVGEPDPELLRAHGSGISLVQLTWAGYDRYAKVLPALPENLAICNASGAFGKAMSQYVLAQTLSIMQNLPQYAKHQAQSLWQDAGPTDSLDGANVLVLGAGDIGSWVAKRFGAFGCSIVGVCRNVEMPREGVDRLVSLDEAHEYLPWADVVVGCLPSSPESAGWLNRERLSLMKPSAVLVNVGRGALVDTDALVDSLERGSLRGVALDVTNPEPLPSDHPLWKQPRCVITPHISGASFRHCEETEDLLCDIACENMRRLSAGEPLLNVVR